MPHVCFPPSTCVRVHLATCPCIPPAPSPRTNSSGGREPSASNCPSVECRLDRYPNTRRCGGGEGQTAELPGSRIAAADKTALLPPSARNIGLVMTGSSRRPGCIFGCSAHHFPPIDLHLCRQRTTPCLLAPARVLCNGPTTESYYISM